MPIDVPPYRYQVTEETTEAYARDGAVLLEQPFHPAWIDGIALAFETILQQHRDHVYGGTVFEQAGRLEITGAVGFQAFVRRWALESQAAEIVARVIGSRQIRLYTDHDIGFGKRGPATNAQIGATSFHIDSSAWGFTGHQVPSFWLALTDIGDDNGPLVAALGSHRKVDRLILPSPNDPAEPVPDGYAPYDTLRPFLDRHRFPMKVFAAKRGDVVVLNPYVVHGSLPQKRDGFRLALSTRWLGDDARWRINPQTRAEADAADDAVDGASPSDARYPVIWDAERGPLGGAPGVSAVHTLTTATPPFSYTEFGRIETQDYV